MYGYYDAAPVYQHFAGVEYLYRREGNWLISDEIGLREAGLQNQVDCQLRRPSSFVIDLFRTQGDVSLSSSSLSSCPYRFRTTWEYADVEQPGWQWVYDYTARLVCPSDFCR